MTARRYNIPSTSSMIAFESAARLLNFTRVSEELNTSQSAVSRHISDLEYRIGSPLFNRGSRGLSLTAEGNRLYEAVSAGLDRINTEINFLSGHAGRKTVTITCSHEISHLFLMPRYAELQALIGEDVHLNVLTQEYDLVGLLDNSLYDIALSYRKADRKAGDVKVILEEEIVPLCSPALLEELGPELSGFPTTSPNVPLLDLSKPNDGWMVWAQWLASHDLAPADFEVKSMTNYVYLLEAAAAGKGIVLGWQGLVERYIENGALVPLSIEAVKTENALFAVLTKAGAGNESARKCLDVLVAS